VSVAGKKAAAEAYQRRFHIVKQTGPSRRRGFLPRDKDVVGPRHSQPRQQLPGGFPEAASGPVADYRPADLLGRGKSLAGRRARLAPAARLDHHETPAVGVTLSHKKEFAADAQALHRDRILISVVRLEAD
jgi:hypothetical protein